MMMYNTRTQDYWGFGLWYSKEHSVLETGSVSVSDEGVGDTYSVGSVRKSFIQ
jgi:hypothetical protein